MDDDILAGYADEADALVRQYEGVCFLEVHGPALSLMPTAPGRVLDVGAGTGRDAAALAAMGHHVVAVEPTAELRTRAAALHPSSRIEWVDDRLPALRVLAARRRQFDLVILSAVWMHLDVQEREQAMPTVAGLLRPGGVMLLSLRHGPSPARRRVFPVSADETILLAKAVGLNVAMRLEDQADPFGRAEVTWTRLGLVRARA
ncbi:MAG TPA: class I SAM-dependent methyltransferase [Methylomirabilota bacterium]|nr:class I SAM-dependent methyltransferase [Methylomirabilota bacterium]